MKSDLCVCLTSTLALSTWIWGRLSYCAPRKFVPPLCPPLFRGDCTTTLKRDVGTERSTLSILNFWFRPWGVTQLLGLRGVPLRPHPSKGSGTFSELVTIFSSDQYTKRNMHLVSFPKNTTLQCYFENRIPSHCTLLSHANCYNSYRLMIMFYCSKPLPSMLVHSNQL